MKTYYQPQTEVLQVLAAGQLLDASPAEPGGGLSGLPAHPGGAPARAVAPADSVKVF